MKYLVKKDKTKRYNFFVSESKQTALKVFGRNRQSLATNFFPAEKNFLFHKNGLSRVLIKNRCVVSGNSKSVYRIFRLSRSMFRRSASFGYISGVTKASW